VREGHGSECAQQMQGQMHVHVPELPEGCRFLLISSRKQFQSFLEGLLFP